MRTLTFLLFSLLFSSGFFTAQAQLDTITFKMVNPVKIVGSGGGAADSLQFEIHVKANNPGTFHTLGTIYISYSQLAFGPTLVSTGGMKRDTAGGLLSETKPALPAPKYNGYSIFNDNFSPPITPPPGDHIAAMGWSTNPFPPFPPIAELTEVPLTYTKLYTIRMKIANAAQTPNLQFNFVRMDGAFFYTTSGGGNALYKIKFDCDLTTLDLGTIQPPVFPVELTAFQAKGMEDRIDLFWETAQEINNKGFFLERRQAGSSEFQSLGWVEGNGSTQEASRYNFVDADVVSGLRYSYRLKQVDFDGSSTYSQIVSAYLSNTTGIITRIYPNPAQGEKVYLELQTEESRTFTYSLSDMTGKVVATQAIKTEAGVNTIPIDLSGISSGVYQLQLADYNRHSWNFRILK